MHRLSSLDSTAVTFDQLLATEDALRRLSNITVLTEETRAALEVAKDVFSCLRFAARITGHSLDLTTLRDRLIDRNVVIVPTEVVPE